MCMDMATSWPISNTMHLGWGRELLVQAVCVATRCVRKAQHGCGGEHIEARQRYIDKWGGVHHDVAGAWWGRAARWQHAWTRRRRVRLAPHRHFGWGRREHRSNVLVFPSFRHRCGGFEARCRTAWCEITYRTVTIRRQTTRQLKNNGQHGHFERGALLLL